MRLSLYKIRARKIFHRWGETYENCAKILLSPETQRDESVSLCTVCKTNNWDFDNITIKDPLIYVPCSNCCSVRILHGEILETKIKQALSITPRKI